MERFPRCLTHERQHSRSDVIERARFARSAATVDRNIVGIRSIPKQIRRREDLVARLPLGRSRAASHYDTADVISHDDREGAIATSLPHLRVDRIDGCRVHFDEYVRIPQFRLGTIFECQHVRTAVLADHHCTHVFILSVLDTKALVERGDQPQRADHQKLDVLEERGSLALDRVTDELADPRDDENHER